MGRIQIAARYERVMWMRVSLSPRGVISINRAAHRALGQADAVVLLFDRVNSLIGLRPGSPDAKNAFRSPAGEEAAALSSGQKNSATTTRSAPPQPSLSTTSKPTTTPRSSSAFAIRPKSCGGHWKNVNSMTGALGVSLASGASLPQSGREPPRRRSVGTPPL